MNRIFSQDVRVDTMLHDSKAFIKTHANQLPHLERFLYTMQACPFILCCRGKGNWSIRFYETLCADRIPVLLDTDVVLPKEEVIHWDTVIIKDSDPKRLVDKVVEWNTRGPAFVRAAQQRCFEVWYKMLRADVFFEHFTGG